MNKLPRFGAKPGFAGYDNPAKAGAVAAKMEGMAKPRDTHAIAKKAAATRKAKSGGNTHDMGKAISHAKR